MPKCSILRCPNNSRFVTKKDGVSYFCFPRNPARFSEWTAIIAEARNELNYKPFKGSVVCTNHFPDSDMYTTTKGLCKLHKNAKPILNLGKKQVKICKDNSDQNNSQNSDQAKNQQLIEQNGGSIEPLWSFNEDSSTIEESPSTFLSIGSILDTPATTVMKQKLNTYVKIIKNKNRHINRLYKQNKRLIKRNITLKNALEVLIKNQKKH